jgi:hypothetical protein
VAVQILRIYDSLRRPPNWTDLVQHGRFVAFSKNIDSGVPCDAEGQPFASPNDATLLVFEAFDEARRFCEQRVIDYPAIRFDVYDSDGRVNPPLLTIVNPSRAGALDEHPRTLRRRMQLAMALFAASIVLLVFSYLADKEGVLVVPTFLAISFIVAAVRLLLVNIGVRDAERVRQARVARSLSRRDGD